MPSSKCVRKRFSEPVTTLPDEGVSGNTGASSDGSQFQGSCTTANSPERVFGYNLDRFMTNINFTVTTASSSDDSVTYVRLGDCADSGTEVACLNTQSGGENVTLINPAQGYYYIFVDGDFDTGIPFDLSVSGTLAVGEACVPADAQFPCQPNTSCVGNICQLN